MECFSADKKKTVLLHNCLFSIAVSLWSITLALSEIKFNFSINVFARMIRSRSTSMLPFGCCKE